MAPKIVRFLPDSSEFSTLLSWPAPLLDDLVAGTPGARGRILIEDQRYGLAAGVVHADAYTTRLRTHDRHTFFLVQAGEVVIGSETGEERLLRAGDGFVLPAGSKSSWRQSGSATLYFMSFLEAAPEPSAETVVTIDRASELKPSVPPADDLLISPRPTTHIVASFATSENRWSAGIWDATPYHRKIVPFPRYEFMHLLAGEVSFTGPDGVSERFVEGDSFLVPEGTVSDWKSDVYVKKIYCVYRP